MATTSKPEENDPESYNGLEYSLPPNAQSAVPLDGVEVDEDGLDLTEA